jgi:hypothetical protein
MWKQNICFEVRAVGAVFYTLEEKFSSPPTQCRAGPEGSMSELLAWVLAKGGRVSVTTSGVLVMTAGQLAHMAIAHPSFHSARNFIGSHVCKLLSWSYTLAAK